MGTIKFTLKPGECRTVLGRRFCNRWKPRTAGATEEYIRGVKDPRRPWAKSTCEAQNRYKAGVDSAHARGALKKGVKKTGFVGWRQKTLRKGPTRFAQGVMDAGDTYAKGFGPYYKLMPHISMPKRFPRGDPRNINRCSAVTSALGQLKVGMMGADDKTCPSK
jgi:hypothetical protein